MNSKVNVKFVIILSAVLVAIFAAVALTFVTVFLKSGADHVRTGDTAMAAGDYAAAERAYGKAVRKDRSKVDWLTKYRTALENYRTDNLTDYQKLYRYYNSTLQDIARAKQTDVEAHEEFLSLVRREAEDFGSAGTWQRLEQVADEALQNFEYAQPEDNSWERLKRYRGMARAKQLLLNRDYDENLGSRAREDLERALELDPSDADSLTNLTAIDFLQLRTLMARQRRDEARELGNKALERVRAFIAANPEHPTGLVRRIEVENDPSMRQLNNVTTPIDMEAVRKDLERAISLYAKADPESISVNELEQLQRLEVILTRNTRIPLTRALVDELVEKRPNSTLLGYYRARMLGLTGDLRGGIEAMQAIIDAPNLPISLDGLLLFEMRESALEMQSQFAFTLWESAVGDEDVQAEAIALMKNADSELRSRYPADSPSLLLSGGRLLYAQNDLPEARRRLVAFTDEAQRSDGQAFWILSLIAAKNQNWTEQAERLERLLQVDPGNFRAAIALAEVYGSRLRRDDQALELYQRLASAVPEGPQREEIERRMNLLRAMAGQEFQGDPVDGAIVRAFTLYNGDAMLPGDSDAALAVLLEALEAQNYHPRLVIATSQMHVFRNEIPQAAQVIRTGLERHPDNEQLQRLAPVANAQNADQLVDLAIDSSTQMSDARKLLAKSDARRERGNLPAARELLAQAMAKDPNDPIIVEAVFRDALERGDRETAQAQVRRARDGDMDGLKGMTFEARYEMSVGNDQRALNLLTEAKRLRADHVNLLRLLALHQLSMGLNNEALDTFREAIALRGTDTNLVSDYVNSLVRLGRGPEALSALQELGTAVGGRRDLVELRLDLEADHGDRAKAVAARQTLLDKEPANRLNKRKLAALLIEQGEFTSAKRLIDQLRNEGDDLDIARLEAVWYGAQGDISGGRQVFTSYIGRLMQKGDDEMTADPYLALGGFLLRYREVADGIVALRQAKRFEDPETLVVEKNLGEALRTHNRFEEAAEAFRNVVEAGKDDSNASYRKRLVDALLRVGKLEEASRQLDAMANRESSDHTILLLRADVAEAQKNFRAARTALDTAIRTFPNVAGVYARRAQLIVNQAESELNDQLLRDALTDLNSALRIEPNSPTILRMRGQVHLELGQLDDAMADLKSAVRANPSNDEFFQGVMVELTRLDRSNEASALAEEVLQARPGDPRLLTIAGAVFAVGQDWDRALPFFTRAWERVRDAQTGAQYVTVLLRLSPPRYAEARDVLAALGSQVENDWSLLMFRSQVLLRQGQSDASRRDATRAFRLAETDPGTLTAWFNRALEAYTADEIVPLLDEVAKLTQRPDWIKLFRADALAKSESTWAQSQRMLDELIAASAEPQVRLNAYQSKSRELLRREQYDAAVATLQAAVNTFPDNWLMLNNLAYTLTVNLNKPAEAVPFARRAAEKVPPVGRPDVLDTLGWSLALTDELGEAEIALEEALRMVGRGRSRPVILLHLAYVKAKQGDGEAARQHVDSLQRIAREGLPLPEQYGSLMTEVEGLIQNIS